MPANKHIARTTYTMADIVDIGHSLAARGQAPVKALPDNAPTLEAMAQRLYDLRADTGAQMAYYENVVEWAMKDIHDIIALDKAIAAIAAKGNDNGTH